MSRGNAGWRGIPSRSKTACPAGSCPLSPISSAAGTAQATPPRSGSAAPTSAQQIGEHHGHRAGETRLSPLARRWASQTERPQPSPPPAGRGRASQGPRVGSSRAQTPPSRPVRPPGPIPAMRWLSHQLAYPASPLQSDDEPDGQGHQGAVGRLSLYPTWGSPRCPCL